MNRTEREKLLLSRNELLEILQDHFKIVPTKWDRENTECFTIYDTDINRMSFRYNSISIPNSNFLESKIYEIYINTWSGGWGHLSSFIKIEWDYKDTGYKIEYALRKKNMPSMTAIINDVCSSNVIKEIIRFFKFAEPEKTIPLERDLKLNEIL